MTDQIEQPADDSTGATEAPDHTQEMIESAADTTEATSDLDEPLYEIEDIKVSARELKEWKLANETKKSKDADYTQKTQKLSAEKKAFDEKQTVLDSKIDLLGSMESEIESLLLGELKDVNLDKVLAEEGTDEFLRLQREIEKRKSGLGNVSKKFQEVQKQYFQEAYQQLSNSLGWADDGKRQADMTAIQNYVKDSGIPEKDFNKVTSPKVMSAILEAAKYRDLMKNKASIEKKVIQAPKISKPATSHSTKPLSLAERMYGKSKQS